MSKRVVRSDDPAAFISNVEAWEALLALHVADGGKKDAEKLANGVTPRTALRRLMSSADVAWDKKTFRKTVNYKQTRVVYGFELLPPLEDDPEPDDPQPGPEPVVDEADYDDRQTHPTHHTLPKHCLLYTSPSPRD